MATENAIPTSIVLLEYYTGVLSDIVDDPTAADSNYLISPINRSSKVRVSFDTPSALTSSDQEFTAWIRQTNTSVSGKPKARIELWENGTLLSRGSYEKITGAGQLLSYKWVKSALSDQTGAGVEMRIRTRRYNAAGTANDNAADVGAMRWLADVVSPQYLYTTSLVGGTTAVYSASATAGAVTLFPSAIFSSTTIHTPYVYQDTTLETSLVTNVSTIHTPEIDQKIYAIIVNTNGTVFEPELLNHYVTLQPPLVVNVNVVRIPFVLGKICSVEPITVCGGNVYLKVNIL